MADFVINGFKWGSPAAGTQGGTVTWSFATVGRFFKLDMPASAHYQTIIRSAFQTWEDVIPLDFVEVSDPSGADIRIGFEGMDGPYGQGGEARTWGYSDSSGAVEKVAEIRLDGFDPWSGDRLMAVSLHEIGHAIGLGHSTNPGSIMMPSIPSGMTTLGTVDIAGAQTIYGIRGGQPVEAIIAGTSGQDVLSGSSVNETFVPAGGDDVVYAGRGTDIVRFSGAGEEYRIDVFTDTIQVSDLRAGRPDGFDILRQVERLQFSDGTLALDIDQTAGQAYRLYQAAFDRTPDAEGLSYWVRKMDGGLVLHDAASNFIASYEFAAKYGSLSHAGFVNQLYVNILGRGADQGGIDFWSGKLNSGEMDRASVLVGFSESPENVSLVADSVRDGIWLV